MKTYQFAILAVCLGALAFAALYQQFKPCPCKKRAKALAAAANTTVTDTSSTGG